LHTGVPHADADYTQIHDQTATARENGAKSMKKQPGESSNHGMLVKWSRACQRQGTKQSHLGVLVNF